MADALIVESPSMVSLFAIHTNIEIGIQGLLSLKLRIFEKEEVTLAIASQVGVNGQRSG